MVLPNKEAVRGLSTRPRSFRHAVRGYPFRRRPVHLIEQAAPRGEAGPRLLGMDLLPCYRVYSPIPSELSALPHLVRLPVSVSRT